MAKKLDRRSFLRRIGATASLGALGVVTGTGAARAQVTDRDSGSNADPGGQGRGGRRRTVSGITDSDGGATADRANYGRGTPGGAGSGTGCSDNDGGASADPANTAPCPDY
jgi:hypothetical protein